MTHSTRSALIVGAGIGGLAAAIALRRAGWEIQVLERARSPRELGFALLLAPNAMTALRELGLADAVIAGGVVATGGEMRRANGDLLRRFNTSAVMTALGEPTVTVLRPVLHGALMDAVGHDTLSLEREVVGVDADHDGVQVRLADRTTVRADVLIGADGVKSIIRAHFHPHEGKPRPSGLFALRGVAFGVTHWLGDTSGRQYFGRGVEAGLAKASDTAVYWYLSLPAELVTAGSRTPGDVLARATAGFHEPFLAIVLATRAEDMRLDELFDRDPLDTWGSGPVTLLGDAAHPMLPHAGQGAAQALEDAVALGRALDTTGDPEASLRGYERRRVARTRAVVQLARRNARMGSVRNAVGCRLRDAAIRYVPEALILKQLVALGRPPDDQR